MTKQQRERVRRHAAVIAVAQAQPTEEVELGHWDALARWRGDDAGAKGQPFSVARRTRSIVFCVPSGVPYGSSTVVKSPASCAMKEPQSGA